MMLMGLDSEGRAHMTLLSKNLEVGGLDSSAVFFGTHVPFQQPKQRLVAGRAPDGTFALKVYDELGVLRTVLGSILLESVRTGSLERRSESSLVFFDKDGGVIWQTP